MSRIHPTTGAQNVERKKPSYDTSEVINSERHMLEERDRASESPAIGGIFGYKLAFRLVIFNEMAFNGNYPVRVIKMASLASLLISFVGLAIAIWSALSQMPVVLVVSLFLFNLIFLLTATLIHASSKLLCLFYYCSIFNYFYCLIFLKWNEIKASKPSFRQFKAYVYINGLFGLLSLVMILVVTLSDLYSTLSDSKSTQTLDACLVLFSVINSINILTFLVIWLNISLACESAACKIGYRRS